MFAYVQISLARAYWYVTWAKEAKTELETDGQCASLENALTNDKLRAFRNAPDVILDWLRTVLPAKGVPSWVETIADKVSEGSVVLGFVMIFAGRDVYLINRFLFTMAFLYAANLVSEQVTIIPPVLGLDKCLEKIKAIEDGTRSSTRGTGLTMMWSGHTVSTMLGTWGFTMGLLSMLQPKWWRLGGVNTWWITLTVSLMGLLEGVLLLLHWGHYTVDIWIAILMAIFATHSTELAYVATFVNPFLPPLPVYQ